MVKIDTRVLAEVRADFAGLLEPVRNLEERLRLLAKPHRLQRLASLALGSEVWVYWNQSREFAEADLRFRGPLARGSSGVYFGVQLKVRSPTHKGIVSHISLCFNSGNFSTHTPSHNCVGMC